MSDDAVEKVEESTPADTEDVATDNKRSEPDENADAEESPDKKLKEAPEDDKKADEEEEVADEEEEADEEEAAADEPEDDAAAEPEDEDKEE